jgi:hypothetical protein
MENIFQLNPFTIVLLILAGVVGARAARVEPEEKIFYRILYPIFMAALFLLGAVIFLVLFFQLSDVVRPYFR